VISGVMLAVCVSWSVYRFNRFTYMDMPRDILCELVNNTCKVRVVREALGFSTRERTRVYVLDLQNPGSLEREIAEFEYEWPDSASARFVGNDSLDVTLWHQDAVAYWFRLSTHGSGQGWETRIVPK
jgi:hypothetical protein